MNVVLSWVGLASVAVAAFLGVRAAFVAYRTKDAKDNGRVLRWGIALCVLGPVCFAVAMVPLFVTVAGTGPTQRSILLSGGTVCPIFVMQTALAAGCSLLLTSGILRALSRR